MICPLCNGRKSAPVLACPGARIIDMPCEACRATGAVDDQYPEWLERGRALKRLRMEPRYRDMREAANLVGVDVVEYSRMERGLSDPTRAERALEANGA